MNPDALCFTGWTLTFSLAGGKVGYVTEIEIELLAIR